MNPLKLYIKNRLEKLEEENAFYKEKLDRMFRENRYHEELGMVFEKMICDLNLQIEYIRETNVYHIYSDLNGEIKTIYVIKANKFPNEQYVKILLEKLPLKGENNDRTV